MEGGQAVLSRAERRKARTAEAILDAAERLFLERGYRETAIQELADEADVAIASLYAHFGSKEGLYLALVERAAELDRSYFDRVYAADLSPTLRLNALADAFLRFYRAHPGLFRLFALRGGTEGPDDVPAAAVVLSARIDEELGRLAGTIDEAVREGAIRKVDPGRTAKLMWASLTGVVGLHARGDRAGVDEAELEALLDRTQELLMLGLAPR